MTEYAALELRHLRYFVAVAEELNLSRAARRLHLSQPPLTRQIQNLEKMTGAALFTRTARGMELTEAGSVLLGEARNLLEFTTQAMERTRSVGRGELGRIHLGAFGSLMLDAVPQFLAHFSRTHPLIEVVLHTLNRPEQLVALRQRRIGAAFVRGRPVAPDIAAEAYVREHLVAALPTTHSLAKRKRVNLRDLAQLPLVMQGSGPRPNFTDTLLALFANAGLQPVVAQNVGDSITAVAVVAGGFGAALVPASTRHLRLPGVAFVPVSDIPLATADILCIYRAEDRSPVLQAFLRELRVFRRGMKNARVLPGAQPL